jgi:hypothetical protein
MFRSTMCPSSGADDCVMLQPCVGMCRGCRKVVKTGWQVVRPPSCSHGTYQHKAITSRSRQLVMMGTWLAETCWATIRREIKKYKKWHLVGFSYPHWITMHGQPHIRFCIHQFSARTSVFPHFLPATNLIISGPFRTQFDWNLNTLMDFR